MPNPRKDVQHQGPRSSGGTCRSPRQRGYPSMSRRSPPCAASPRLAGRGPSVLSLKYAYQFMHEKLFGEMPWALTVFPAKAGIQHSPVLLWIPASAGMTWNWERISETGRYPCFRSRFSADPALNHAICSAFSVCLSWTVSFEPSAWRSTACSGLPGASDVRPMTLTLSVSWTLS